MLSKSFAGASLLAMANACCLILRVVIDPRAIGGQPAVPDLAKHAPTRRSAGTRFADHSLYSSREASPVRKIKALRLYNPGIHRDFSLSYAPFENARKIKMLEASLSQLEQLVSDLVQQNQALVSTNQSLTAELAQAKDENESLQLSLMEQEEKQGATVARIQALVERVSAGPVNA
jgi:hypothetical protein